MADAAGGSVHEVPVLICGFCYVFPEETLYFPTGISVGLQESLGHSSEALKQDLPGFSGLWRLPGVVIVPSLGLLLINLFLFSGLLGYGHSSGIVLVVLVFNSINHLGISITVTVIAQRGIFSDIPGTDRTCPEHNTLPGFSISRLTGWKGLIGTQVAITLRRRARARAGVLWGGGNAPDRSVCPPRLGW